jgi:ABC-type sugar transport system substrate-binding protein
MSVLRRRASGFQITAPVAIAAGCTGRRNSQSNEEALMVHRTCVAAATALLAAGIATAAPPKVVTLPNSDAQCFAPWASNTKLFQYPAKKGPYRIALANGYIANTWRIQMIKTAKAYAAQPEVAA